MVPDLHLHRRSRQRWALCTVEVPDQETRVEVEKKAFQQAGAHLSGRNPTVRADLRLQPAEACGCCRSTASARAPASELSSRVSGQVNGKCGPPLLESETQQIKRNVTLGAKPLQHLPNGLSFQELPAKGGVESRAKAVRVSAFCTAFCSGEPWKRGELPLHHRHEG